MSAQIHISRSSWSPVSLAAKCHCLGDCALVDELTQMRVAFIIREELKRKVMGDTTTMQASKNVRDSNMCANRSGDEERGT